MSFEINCHIWIYKNAEQLSLVLDPEWNVSESISEILSIHPDAVIVPVDPDLASKINAGFENQFESIRKEVQELLIKLFHDNLTKDVA